MFILSDCFPEYIHIKLMCNVHLYTIKGEWHTYVFGNGTVLLCAPEKKKPQRET